MRNRLAEIEVHLSWLAEEILEKDMTFSEAESYLWKKFEARQDVQEAFGSRLNFKEATEEMMKKIINPQLYNTLKTNES
jgi:hypothetical protein